MKHFNWAVFPLMVLVPLLSKAQKETKSSAANTTQVKTIEVFGDNENIAGDIRIGEKSGSKIYLVGYGQKKNDSGIFVTEFKFASAENDEPYVDLNINLQFDKPFESAQWDGGDLKGTAMDIGYDRNKTKAYFGARQFLLNGRILKLTILSKSASKWEIEGLSGKSDQH